MIILEKLRFFWEFHWISVDLFIIYFFLAIMCDKSNSNSPLKMLYYASYFISVIIVIIISFAKLSLWILRLFAACLSKIFFKISHAIVVEVLKKKNNRANQNDPSDANFDHNGYVTVDEETLDEFHNSHQYIHWELPRMRPNSIPCHLCLHFMPFHTNSNLHQ